MIALVLALSVQAKTPPEHPVNVAFECARATGADLGTSVEYWPDDIPNIVATRCAIQIDAAVDRASLELSATQATGEAPPAKVEEFRQGLVLMMRYLAFRYALFRNSPHDTGPTP